jgi:hypothetical protein
MSPFAARRPIRPFARMSSKINIPEGADATAGVIATSARGLPSRRLSVAPMMDWTEESQFS